MATDEDAAAQIAAYALRNELWFGDGPRSPQRPLSWAIAMSPVELERSTFDYLRYHIPGVLQEFVSSAGVESQGESEPICIRPDFVVAEDGHVAIVECNVDRRLDRGIAIGVEDYTVESGIAEPSHLVGLARAYSDLLRSDASTESRVGIVVEPSRSNYRAQEALFARALTDAGVVADIVQLDSHGEVEGWPPGGFILPELEGLASEWPVRLGILARQWRPVGCPRGYDDKALLVQGSARFPDISPTFNLDDPSLAASPWGSRAGLAIAKPAAVLKRAGTTDSSTESRGVEISLDCSPEKWREAVDVASANPAEWIVQRFVEGQRLPVEFKETPLGKTRSSMAPYRLTGYYVRSSFAGGSTYQLAHLNATMGTDREMLLGRSHLIRTRRQCAYAVVRSK